MLNYYDTDQKRRLNRRIRHLVHAAEVLEVMLLAKIAEFAAALSSSPLHLSFPNIYLIKIAFHLQCISR